MSSEVQVFTNLSFHGLLHEKAKAPLIYAPEIVRQYLLKYFKNSKLLNLYPIFDKKYQERKAKHSYGKSKIADVMWVVYDKERNIKHAILHEVKTGGYNLEQEVREYTAGFYFDAHGCTPNAPCIFWVKDVSEPRTHPLYIDNSRKVVWMAPVEFLLNLSEEIEEYGISLGW